MFIDTINQGPETDLGTGFENRFQDQFLQGSWNLFWKEP
jgi:hypothetical protein